MRIGGFDKLSLLNYPGMVAATIFTQGCNLKCPFCQNSELIPVSPGAISESEIFAYLEKRKKVLDGVCISGGEPLVQKDIKDFIKKIKGLNLKVKIDTNGTNPILLKELIDEKLVDYVAMDVKNEFILYDKTSGAKVNIDNIKKSIEIIENSNINYEFRTTIVKELHNVDNIKNIRMYLSNKSKYYIQNYEYSENVIDKSLHGFSKEELKNMKNKINNVEVRE